LIVVGRVQEIAQHRADVRRDPFMRRIAIVLIVLGASAASAGCGGGSGGTRLSNAEFATQGGKDVPDEPTQAQIDAYFGKVIANIRAQVDEIDALRPPKEIQATVDGYVKDARAVLTMLEKEGATNAFAREDDPFENVNLAADKLGLHDCSDA
jgi:hypothetical protein